MSSMVIKRILAVITGYRWGLYTINWVLLVIFMAITVGFQMSFSKDSVWDF